MSTVVVEMPAQDLTKGLYVCGLDRPWEGTPFLFQGFVIESDTELQMLQQLCKCVFVEASVEDAERLRSVYRKAATAVVEPLEPDDPLTILSRNPAALVVKGPSKEPVGIETELNVAKGVFTEAKQAIGTVFDHLRRGGSLDVPQLQSVVGSMVDSIFRNRDALSWLASMKNKDDYVYAHSLASSVWALAFGRHLGLDKETLTLVGTGAMLLDIGKTRLPDELLKKPGAPNDAEWRLIRAHADRSVELLQATAPVDPRIIQMVATHHERIDGSGYPDGLKGDAIPFLGRVGAIVDCYDAMISHRSYAAAKSTYDAVRELKQLARVGLPADLVDLFIQAIGVFPTGSLVELNTGEVGIVVGQNRYRRLRPEIMLILDAGKAVRREFVKLDLLTCPDNNSTSEPGMWIARSLEPGAYGVDPLEYFL
jgi:HD-GYP domain-containing protein (c-di-GMP phosphodiesterase class II)